MDTDSAGSGSHQRVQTAAGKLTEVAFLGPVIVAGTPKAAAPPAPPAVVPTEPARSAYWNGAQLAMRSGIATSGACVMPASAGVGSCTQLTNALNSNGTDAHLEESLLVGGAVLIAVGRF